MTTDSILLEGLRAECIIGDLPHERLYPQELYLNLELFCDLHPAALSDNLSDTVNYVAVIDAIRDALSKARCKMLERAGEVAINTAFSVDPRITAVTLTLRKPHALPGVVPGIHIHRERP